MINYPKLPLTAMLHEDPQWKICGPGGQFDILAITAMGNDEIHAKYFALATNYFPELFEVLKKELKMYAPDSKRYLELKNLFDRIKKEM